jgi:hypothetical protein
MPAAASTAKVMVMRFVILFRVFMSSPIVNKLVKGERHICARLLRRKGEAKTIIGEQPLLRDATKGAVIGLLLALYVPCYRLNRCAIAE